MKIEDDPRPAHQRRMDALIEIVARGVASPGDARTTDMAKVVVTIDFETLRDQTTQQTSPHFTRTSSKAGAGTASRERVGRSEQRYERHR